uniref:Rga2 protein n=1 Tax=Macalpinomyces eriachnes TaxID=307738 RepID=H2CZ38_9BASI|nr:Rga2 protein [Macalpinomyces eriachnes]
MEKLRAGFRSSTLTKEELKRRIIGSKPGWVDLIDPIAPRAAYSDTIRGDIFLQNHTFRCPADSPRLSRRWSDRSLPRTVRSLHIDRNRLSPLSYHTFENRFGRFADLAWKVPQAQTRKVWAFLSTLKLPTQALIYTDAIDCVDAFSQVANLDQLPRRKRRRNF